MAEAAARFHQGLDQLALLRNNLKRQSQELEFWSALGPVSMTVKGFGAPRTGHAYGLARELREQLGSPAEFLQVPFGQSLHHVFHGELDITQRLDEDLLRLSRQRDGSAGLLLVHVSSGRNLMYRGKFAAPRARLEAACAL